LREKWRYKESIAKTKENEQVAGRMKFCPVCGSANINFVVFYRPSIWKCLNCGYEGAFIVEDGKLGAKIRQDYQKALGEK
jgi:DNA-directed RNA polymerase subunit M